MNRSIILLTSTLFVTAIPAVHAQWAVIDVDSFQALTEGLQKTDKIISQGQDYINIANSTYGLAEAMAKPGTGLFNFTTPNNPYAVMKYQNQYGTTGTFATAANSGDPASIAKAINDTVVNARPYTGAFADLEVGVANSMRARYSTMELMDGHLSGALQTVGQVRSAIGAFENALYMLEKHNTGEDPNSVQSQLAVQQRTAAAAAANARLQHDTNSLLSTMIDGQVATMKLQRDALAQGANQAMDEAFANQAVHPADENLQGSFVGFNVGKLARGDKN